MDMLLDTRPMPTRLQMESASRMAQGLAKADARQKNAALFAALDDMLRALKAIEACGASKAFLWDTAAGLHDQVNGISGRIDRDLDEQGLVPLESPDLAELDAFLAKVA
jgi:hypothetical protein